MFSCTQRDYDLKLISKKQLITNKKNILCFLCCLGGLCSQNTKPRITNEHCVDIISYYLKQI